MSKSLLDTDIYSEVLKAIDQTVVNNAIAYRKAQGILTISAVTLMEIMSGYQRKQASRKIQNFLAAVALEEIIDVPAKTPSTSIFDATP